MIGSQARDANERPTGLMRSALADAGAVTGVAFRLLWRHWPVLIALFLGGIVAHELLLRAAVEASGASALLGAVILLLAPIATLVAFILMLRALKPSLPWLSQAIGRGSTVDDGRTGLLSQLGSILVPFLTVYASYGYLREDLSEYAYRVWEDETLNNPEAFSNPGSIDVLARLPFSPGVALVALVVVALALRWAVDRWQAAQRRPWLTLPAAYAESVWITLGVVVMGEVSDQALGWLETRRLVHWGYQLWYDVTAALGPLTGPARAAGSWIWGLVTTSTTEVIVVPIAWLVVGAVVYGHRIAPPPPLAVELYRRTRGRWPSVPVPVHRVGAQLGALVTGRFGTLVYGLRLVLRAGLFPMLLFCLAFVVAGGAEEWLWELERLAIGPRDLNSFWMPWSGPLGTLNSTVSWVLLACLLAAAIDRVLRVEQPTRSAVDANQGDYPDVVSRA